MERLTLDQKAVRSSRTGAAAASRESARVCGFFFARYQHRQTRRRCAGAAATGRKDTRRGVRDDSPRRPGCPRLARGRLTLAAGSLPQPSTDCDDPRAGRGAFVCAAGVWSAAALRVLQEHGRWPPEGLGDVAAWRGMSMPRIFLWPCPRFVDLPSRHGLCCETSRSRMLDEALAPFSSQSVPGRSL